MKTILNFAALVGLICFGSGCVVPRPQIGHQPSPPTPAPPPANSGRAVAVARQQSAPAPTHAAPVSAQPRRDACITAHERKIIQQYTISDSEAGSSKHGKNAHGAKSLPPGLAKKAARGESLPPGWQKKVVKGEIIPVEIYRECRPLPNEVIVKLPAPPIGTILVTIESKVVRLLEATREILDVFEIRGAS